MIGLGSQDTLPEAQDFVTRYGTSFTMLWDETFESWAQLGVTSQPTAALFAADGEQLGAWVGEIPEDEVLRLIGG